MFVAFAAVRLRVSGFGPAPLEPLRAVCDTTREWPYGSLSGTSTTREGDGRSAANVDADPSVEKREGSAGDL
jgi:hypothetical protein